MAEADALNGPRVLVVEDEAPIALDLRSILAGLGCVVLGPAPSVPEALHLLATDPPDAVTLDLDLRGAYATPIAKACAARGIRFVVISAYGVLPEPVFDGAPVVTKPYAPDRIRRALLGLAGP